MLTIDQSAPVWAQVLVNKVNQLFLAIRPDNAVKLTGGTIDGIPIGVTTPAAGHFTNVTASGTTTLGGLTSTTLSITQGPIISGTYLPTLTNVANLDASTAYNAQYMRVGNVVNVSGKVDVDPTALLSTKLGISLPVASTLSAAEKCGGNATSNTVVSECAGIEADTANNRAQMEWITTNVTNHSMYFDFQYLVT